MENQKLSKLQFYSLGIIANNKLPTSDMVEVTPVEEFPMLDGEITDNVESYKADFKDANAVPFKMDMKSTVTIKAKWLPINNSNRRSSPDVRRGENVVLYRFADTDEYWWNTLKNDNKLRRLETVIYSFSNLRKENVEDGPTTSYWLEVSTHKKLMHVHTSKNDGEPYAYDVQINAKEGNLVITDDVGNYIVLDSAEKTIHLQNTLGSYVDINKSDITIKATNITLNGSKVVVNSDSTNINGSSSITIKSPATSVN
jgi:hypothetical protein